MTIHNDRQNYIADVFKSLSYENLPPEKLKREIVESIQIDGLADTMVQHNTYFIRIILQTLEHMWIYKQSQAAHKHELLVRRVILSSSDP